MSVLSALTTKLNENKKWAKDVKPEKGKMHKLLGLKDDETVTGKYTSGESLAKALMRATNNNEKEVTGMLAFAANVDKADNVLDSALSYMKQIGEELDPEADKASVDGDPVGLVKALLKYAPGKSTEIGTMLKYAANSNPEYDIFDASLDYFQSMEDNASDVEDEVLGDEEPTDELPTEEPTEELPTEEEPVDEVPAEDEEDFDIEL